jgi:DNA-binding NarL/FixJ family response regulator
MALGSTLAMMEGARARREVSPRGVKANPSGRTKMTPRLRQVYDCIAEGLPDKEIATRLGVSLGTVKVYTHEVYEFTGKRRVDLQREGFRPSLADAEGMPRMGAFE